MSHATQIDDQQFWQWPAFFANSSIFYTFLFTNPFSVLKSWAKGNIKIKSKLNLFVLWQNQTQRPMRATGAIILSLNVYNQTANKRFHNFNLQTCRGCPWLSKQLVSWRNPNLLYFLIARHFMLSWISLVSIHLSPEVFSRLSSRFFLCTLPVISPLQSIMALLGQMVFHCITVFV